MLILLPTAILAGIGFYLLRQDRLAVENEARANAQQIAETALQAITNQWNLWESWTSDPANSNSRIAVGHLLAIRADGSLAWPRYYPKAPEPKPLDLAVLNAEQAKLWNEARRLEQNDSEREQARSAFQAFTNTQPPDLFSAQAAFSLSILQIKQDHKDQALDSLMMLDQRYPDLIVESGLPLRHLVYWQLLQLARSTNGAVAFNSMSRSDEMASNLVTNPSILSADLLRLLGATAKNQSNTVETWQAYWQRDEQARAIYKSASGEIQKHIDRFKTEANAGASSIEGLSPFWPATAPGYLLLPLGSREGIVFFLCATERDLGRLLETVLEGPSKAMSPAFLGIVKLAGKSVAHLSNKANSSSSNIHSKDQPPLWGSVALNSGGFPILQVNLYLENDAALLATHHLRLIWFALILVFSSLAAVLGWLAAYRAFQRQLRLNEMKSDFVSSVSHELRAPIASVRLMAEGLESGRVKNEEKRQDYFRFIVQECRRLTSLIENILDFSRIEQGRKQYDFEPTDITALVQQTGRLMENYAAERDVKLKLDLDLNNGSAAHPALDGRAIQQALVNLIDNAIKHSPKGLTVTIGLDINSTVDERNTQHATRCRLWVEDHGPGIPPTEHTRIFERFYRLGSELRRETPGVGIGLSIVKHIVEAHGGTVLIRSAPGQGSRFTIELPINNSRKLRE